MTEIICETETGKTILELSREADQLLKSGGYTIFGSEKQESTYLQNKFECGMKTGAFSQNSARGKRRK